MAYLWSTSTFVVYIVNTVCISVIFSIRDNIYISTVLSIQSVYSLQRHLYVYMEATRRR